MNRVFLTGDVHQNIDIGKLTTKNFPIQSELTKDDYIIILGDCGFVWDGSKSDQYWQNWHQNKNYTTLGVLGNHEGYGLIKDLPIVEICGGQVKKVKDSVYYLMNGEIYTINGKTFLCCGGADSHDKEFRREGINWWPQERFDIIDVERAKYNLAANNYKTDYILSHTGGSEVCRFLGFNPTVSDENLDIILEAAEYKKGFCGHYHLDKIVNNKTRILYDDIIEISDLNESD